MPRRSPRCFQRVHRSKLLSCSTKALRGFSPSRSHWHPMAFSRGSVPCDNMVVLKAHGLCACVLLCFKIFSILILNTVNVDRYNPYKTKALWGLQAEFMFGNPGHSSAVMKESQGYGGSGSLSFYQWF